MIDPRSSLPDGGKEGFPLQPREREVLSFPRVQPLRRLAVHAGVPVGATFHSARTAWFLWTRSTAWAAPMRAGLPLWLPLHSSYEEVADKCTLCYHRITKGLTTAAAKLPHRRAPVGRPEESKDPNPRIHETHTVQGLKPQMANPAAKLVLQRPGWLGAVRNAAFSL